MKSILQKMSDVQPTAIGMKESIARSVGAFALESTAKVLTANMLVLSCLCAGQNFKAGRLAGALERHQTLGKLWIEGFQVWSNSVNDALATSTSVRGIPSQLQGRMYKWQPATAQSSRPYGWRRDCTICKSAAQESTAKILPANPPSVDVGEKYYCTYYLLTTCLCAGENFKAGRLAGALERHQTLGKLWIEGFQVWSNSVNDALPTSTSGRGIPSQLQGRMYKWQPATAQSSRPYGWRRDCTICKSAAQGSTAKVLPANPPSVDVGEKILLTIYLLLVFVLGNTSKPDHWQERLKGTRLWGSFESKDSKFEATLSMMLFSTSTSGRGIPSHTSSDVQVTASDSTVF